MKLKSLPKVVRDSPYSFVQIPQYRAVVSLEPRCIGKDATEACRELRSHDLKFPGIVQFFVHRENFRLAAAGKEKLKYSDGTIMSQENVVSLWQKLFAGNREEGIKPACFTWLDAIFEFSNQWYMENNLYSEGGNLTGQRNVVDLGDVCDGEADIKLDRDSISFKNIDSPNNGSVYFHKPCGKNRTVAAFGVNSRRSFLSFAHTPNFRQYAAVFPYASG